MSSKPANPKCVVRGCPHRTDRPNHTLCGKHYRAVQNGDIKKCLNCGVICDPPPAQFCPQCGHKNQQIREQRSQYADDSKGWNFQPEPEPSAKAPLEVAQAVSRVRENINTHRRACENHETNTVQYLIMPLLKGLGWDEYNPAHVVKEYKPVGRQRYRQAIAVDVALMNNGSPVAFIEAKRLDREYTDDYMEQLGKYAAHLEDGKTAVLTNGQFWIVCTVANGQPIHQDTIDVASGTADGVAISLNDALGQSLVTNVGAPTLTTAATTHRAAPYRDTIIENLKRYRQRQVSQRGANLNFVLTNEVLSRIADRHPTDLHQLLEIPGIGPATVEQHGETIIAIVTGRWS